MTIQKSNPLSGIFVNCAIGECQDGFSMMPVCRCLSESGTEELPLIGGFLNSSGSKSTSAERIPEDFIIFNNVRVRKALSVARGAMEKFNEKTTSGNFAVQHHSKSEACLFPRRYSVSLRMNGTFETSLQKKTIHRRPSGWGFAHTAVPLI